MLLKSMTWCLSSILEKSPAIISSTISSALLFFSIFWKHILCFVYLLCAFHSFRYYYTFLPLCFILNIFFWPLLLCPLILSMVSDLLLSATFELLILVVVFLISFHFIFSSLQKFLILSFISLIKLYIWCFEFYCLDPLWIWFSL